MSNDDARHLVRPRWVWGGVLLGLAGMLVLGWGIAVLSWSVSVVGIVLLAACAGATLRGGILYDVQGAGGAPTELREAVEGDVHEGTVAGEMVGSERVRQHSAVVDARKRLVLRDRVAFRRAHGAVLAPAGGWVIIAVAVVLLAAQGLYADTTQGQGNANRVLLTAVVLFFCGLRLGTGPDRPHHAAAALAVLLGLSLLVCAFGLGHDSSTTVVLEACCGVVVCGSASLGLAGLRWRQVIHPRG